MKKLILCSAILFSSSVFALPGLPSIYAGIQGGYYNGHTYTNNEIGVEPNDGYGVSIDGTGVRGYVGYNWNSLFGTEIGYAHFKGSNSLSDALGSALANAIIGSFGSSYKSNTDVNQNALDVLGKLSFPVPFVHPYVKLGAAYVKTDLDTKITVTNSYLNINSTTTYDKSTSGIRPVVGVGLESNIFAGLSVDAGWMRYQHVSSDTEDTDFFMVGLSYNFG